MCDRINLAQAPIILLTVFLSATSVLAAPGNDTKPNIVLVLMDNFGYGEIGPIRWLCR